MKTLAAAALLALAMTAGAATLDEPHQRLDLSQSVHARDAAITLDACGGAYDRELIATLLRLNVPATIFFTKRWLDSNPEALRELRARPDLFEFEDHGAAHVPAAVGTRVWGMASARDAQAIEREIAGGAQAVTRAAGAAPHWFRGAGAAYDGAGLRSAGQLGYRIAGFSLNADHGATLGAAAVAQRLRRLRLGDIVIAHLNKPAGGTAEGFAAALPELLARGQVRFVKLSQAAGVVTVAER